jgi:dephospho-CoA kinase
MKVIGVVGLPASGKGEFARIAAARGIPVITMGDMIRHEVKKAGMEPTDENLGSMGNRLREERGMDAIAHLCIPEIRKQSAPLVLVDGIRGDSEVMLFEKQFPGFVLVGIESPFAARLARLTSRGRSDDTTPETSLQARDERELSWGLGAALALADYHLKNDKDLPVFKRRVRALLKRLEEST